MTTKEKLIWTRLNGEYIQVTREEYELLLESERIETIKRMQQDGTDLVQRMLDKWGTTE